MQNIIMARPWLQGTPINIAGQAHAIPKNAEKCITKFRHNGMRTVEEYMRLYKDAPARFNVTHEDVAYQLFSSSLDEQTLDWYVSLPQGSITSWDQLVTTSISQFNIPIDPTVLYHQFAVLKQIPKHQVRLFNERFQKVHSRLVPPYNIEKNIALQSYFRALDPWIFAFIRRESTITTLSKAYEEVV